MRKPILIIVSGPPGSGKTTLARALAQRLCCPAVIRDEIKQAMLLTHPEVRDHSTLNIPTLHTFFEVIGVQVRAGVTLVAEAAFQHKLWQPNLLPLVGLADLRILRCTAPASLLRDRITTRVTTDPHRRAHADTELLAPADATPPRFDPLRSRRPRTDSAHRRRLPPEPRGDHPFRHRTTPAPQLRPFTQLSCGDK